MNKVRVGDEVQVISGRDKGKRGKILRILHKKGSKKVIVEGLKLVKKHVKPNPQANVEGGIVEKESPIHLSNLALLNPTTNKADKVGFKIIEAKNAGEKSKKVRYFKSNNELVDSVG